MKKPNELYYKFKVSLLGTNQFLLRILNIQLPYLIWFYILDHNLKKLHILDSRFMYMISFCWLLWLLETICRQTCSGLLHTGSLRSTIGGDAGSINSLNHLWFWLFQVILSSYMLYINFFLFAGCLWGRAGAIYSTKTRMSR